MQTMFSPLAFSLALSLSHLLPLCLEKCRLLVFGKCVYVSVLSLSFVEAISINAMILIKFHSIHTHKHNADDAVQPYNTFWWFCKVCHVLLSFAFAFVH